MTRAEKLARLKAMLRKLKTETDPVALADKAEEREAAGFESMGVAPKPIGEADDAREGVEKLLTDREEQVTDQELDGLEAIVMKQARPVVFIRNNRFDDLPAPWTPLNATAVRQRLQPLLTSIGRIDLPTNMQLPYGGTGFVVGEGLLMTNRHVARLFAEGLGTRGLVFRPGDAAVDFKCEIDTPEGDRSAYLEVRQVLMIHPYWDMALLKVEGLAPGHASLRLSVHRPEDLVDQDVVAIGYPARDGRNDLGVQDRIFGGKYDVKRLQPGKLRHRESIRSFENTVSAVTHDSSTLGGNSGSAIVHVKTGEVVGLHFAGVYLKANYAVPTYELARDARVVEAGLNFTGQVPATRDWDDVWSRIDGERPQPNGRPGPSVVQPGPSVVQVEGGTATCTIPIQVEITLGKPMPAGPAGSAKASTLAEVEARMQVPIIHPDLESREGYRPDFLELSGDEEVPLPQLTAAGKKLVAKLEDGSWELKYQRFSVVVQKKRRLALFTAANVDWRPQMRQIEGQKPSRKKLNGFGGNEREDWVIDPRIPLDHQLPDYFYRKSGAFDRGQLVRCDDVAWGNSFKDMQKGNGDTFHMTNCLPQTPELNRANLGEFNWGALENMIQQHTKTEKVCIFSGPMLADDDHHFHGLLKSGMQVSVQIPRRFWKIIVANHDGQPAAFGFVLDQALAEIDLSTELVVPDGWKRFMKPIAEIEAFLHGWAKLTEFKRWDQFDVDRSAETIKIDTYLEPWLETMAQAGHESIQVDTEPVKLPLLVKLKDAKYWQAPDGFESQAQLGNIVSGKSTADALKRLKEDANVQTIEASREAGVVDCVRSVRFVKATQVHGHNPAEKGDAALIALIDTGIDVLHAAFHDDNQMSRVIEIWDQRYDHIPNKVTPRSLYPSLLADYGHVYTEQDIQGYVQAQAVPPELGRDPNGHGTHVASIAAGRKVGRFAGGVAPKARILLVIPRLQTAPDDPASIGYSSSHVDALAYIKAAAQKRKKPVVVNVSLGMNAGGHDGTSLLETAFDAFSGSGREPGLVIVKSAGNERTLDGHAKIILPSMGGDALRWNCKSSDRPEDLIELWFASCDEMTFRLKDPTGQISPPSSWSGPPMGGEFASGNSYRLSYTRRHRDCGDSRLLVVIRPGTAARIRSGNWELQIATARVVSDGVVHAWVERLNGRPVRFTNHHDEEMTLSIPGTARTVITVGAVGSTFPLCNTETSSYGPTRDHRAKPDLVAPGQDIHAARAGTTTGVIGKTGTSMAAPHVTGAVALVLSRAAKNGGSTTWPSASQVAAALRDGAQFFSGRHTPGVGFGLLDTETLFQAQW